MSYPDSELVEITESRTNKRVSPVAFDISSVEDVERLRARWAELESNPKIMPSRAEGEDASFLGLDIRTMLRGEESSGRNSVHSIRFAPGTEIPAHGMENADAYWYVLNGELDLTIGSQTAKVSAGGFGYAPPNTTQAAANRSDIPAEVFLVHLPAGMDRAFALAARTFRERPDRAAADIWAMLAPFGFVLTNGRALANDGRTNAAYRRVDRSIETFEDFLALRRDWNKLAPIPKLVRSPSDCRNVATMGQEARVILNPEESRGGATAFCNVLRGGVAVPNHHQPTEEETFIVLQGRLRLTVGNITGDDLGPGAFGFAPRYGTHAFQHLGEEDAAVFSMNSPGGHDRGFEAGARDGHREDFPRIITAHGFTFHGPPAE